MQGSANLPPLATAALAAPSSGQGPTNLPLLATAAHAAPSSMQGSANIPLATAPPPTRMPPPSELPAQPRDRPHATRTLRDRGQLAPLSEGRYRLELTASAALRDKLLRARDLMRHQNPTGDLGVLVERAVGLLVAELERKRLGRTARPRAASAASHANAVGHGPPARRAKRPNPDYVPVAVRRAVFERDGERCAFVDAAGRRCEERGWLQLDHALPRGRGGASDADNVRLLCRTHNLLAADRVFGREHVERRRRARRRRV